MVRLSGRYIVGAPVFVVVDTVNNDLIPLRGAAVLFVHRPWISDKLQSPQTHLSQLTSKRAGLLSSPSITAAELWRSNLSWSETMAQSHPAADNVFTGRPARAIVNRFMRDVGPMSDIAPEFPLAAATLVHRPNSSLYYVSSEL
jgi:hypothetical protein